MDHLVQNKPPCLTLLEEVYLLHYNRQVDIDDEFFIVISF